MVFFWSFMVDFVFFFFSFFSFHFPKDGKVREK